MRILTWPLRAICLLFALVLTGTVDSRTHGETPMDHSPADRSSRRQEESERMTLERATRFSQLALDGIVREYPNKPSNVMVGPDSVLSPRAMHPAFYGSFDWHSSVHGHWLLVRLLKRFPDMPIGTEIRDALDKHLSRENMQVEADYFKQRENRSFERMYGWAWALRLVAELHTWDDPDGKRWRANIEPMEQVLVERTLDYLPKLTWPIRTGVHPDTAFALGQILDYARIVDASELETLIVDRAREYYGDDRDYPAAYEPSGEDFFSAGLNEADLMRRILPERDYAIWLNGFFPRLDDGSLGNLLEPAIVSDVTDGKIVHLAGLNLSRAWTLRGIALSLADDNPARQLLLDAAAAHAEAGLEYVFSGHYEGEHWLATFAVYHLDDVGIDPATAPR